MFVRKPNEQADVEACSQVCPAMTKVPTGVRRNRSTLWFRELIG